MTALQAALPSLAAKNVQVLGISTDNDLSATSAWAKRIGVTFPVLSDADGSVCRQFGVYDEKSRMADRALVVIQNGRITYKAIVTDTAVPPEVLAL